MIFRQPTVLIVIYVHTCNVRHVLVNTVPHKKNKILATKIVESIIGQLFNNLQSSVTVLFSENSMFALKWLHLSHTTLNKHDDM